MSRIRMVEALNQALHAAFERDPSVLMLGEDLLDPYGGAFKAARGLSTRFPDRILSTPLSEGAFVGVATGLAMAGQKPIVEFMFGDFIALAFDGLLNLASKSVTMYGQRVPLPILVRCPVGGGRGYGPTHSQSPQKHLLGIPNLELYELSPFHDPREVLPLLLSREVPVVHFEDKILYAQNLIAPGRIDELFSVDLLGGPAGIARVHSDHFDARITLVSTGGTALRALEAARRAFLEREIECELLVPSRLHPLELDTLAQAVAHRDRVLVIEEGTRGGGWATELAYRLQERLWGRLRRPVEILQSADSIIPTAPHLEREVIVQPGHIFDALCREDR